MVQKCFDLGSARDFELVVVALAVVNEGITLLYNAPILCRLLNGLISFRISASCAGLLILHALQAVPPSLCVPAIMAHEKVALDNSKSSNNAFMIMYQKTGSASGTDVGSPTSRPQQYCRQQFLLSQLHLCACKRMIQAASLKFASLVDARSHRWCI